MTDLIKYVKADGTGDYTDLASGIEAIIASGLGAGDVYDSYVLYADNYSYSGQFDANIPYTGVLNIIGSGTWFYPTGTCNISGTSDEGDPNLKMQNFTIVASGTQRAFVVYSGAGFSLEDCYILDAQQAITSSGYVETSNVTAHGQGSATNYFIYDVTGNTIISDSRISYFGTGIRSSGLSVENSVFVGNNSGVSLVGDGYFERVLIENSNGVGIFGSVTPTGFLVVRNSTIDCDIPLNTSGYSLYMEKSILYGSAATIRGTYYPTSTVTDCCVYPSGWSATTPSGVRVLTDNPDFSNRTHNDYRLNFKQTTGSPCINYVDNGKVSSNVTLTVEPSQFTIYDYKGQVFSGQFLPFVYKQDDTLLFSDYDKEVLFANTRYNHTSLSYKFYTRAEFSASGVDTFASFSPDLTDPFPWDWDIKDFSTPEITSEHQYIIPRSIVDVKDTITGFLPELFDSVLFSYMNKESIKPYLHPDYRGVSYDFDLSTEGGVSITWLLEGINQRLIKLNSYNSQHIEEYPLFIAPKYRNVVYPSGLILAGVYGDKYKYLLQSNPNIEYYSDNDDGRFNWIATDLDVHKDARGLRAYKDYLFMTVSEYSNPVYDRTCNPMGPNPTGIGKLLVYDNNGTFEHYISNYTNSSGVNPTGLLLGSGNAHPTDLTVYEDGTLYVADYGESDMLFKYKLAYDYAIIQSSFDRESRILLRENYDNVEL